jgi:hypothetical protein
MLDIHHCIALYLVRWRHHIPEPAVNHVMLKTFMQERFAGSELVDIQPEQV